MRLSSAGSDVVDCSVAIAIDSASTLVVDGDQLVLQVLDAVFVDSQKPMQVLEGVVVAI
jgi:hypothetical protein